MFAAAVHQPTDDLLAAMLDYTEQSADQAAPTEAEQQSHSDCVMVKLDKSKWKSSSNASKCASPSCRKRFTSILYRRRNCSMCGEVFCRDCTTFRRKLSANAKPDPLGTFFQVCELCFNLEMEEGISSNLMREFCDLRRKMISIKESASNADLRNPLCCQKHSALKDIALKKEIQRLSNGYKHNNGFLRGILSEVKVPEWQKLPQWVDSSKATGCFNCRKQFSLLTFKKINCRTGGQVFCSECCKDQIVLYNNGHDVKWAINGKAGAPSSIPSNYKLLPVCCNCSSDLQAIIQQRTVDPLPTKATTYLEKLHTVHKQLSKFEEKIECTLPEYMKIVDALDMTDNSPRSVNGPTPLQGLVKVQTDLSDAFSALAVQSQKLKHLKPETDTETKLQRNVMIGTYHYYSENMFQFRLTKNRLGDLMPTDHLDEIQQSVSQRSIERVHVYLQQLMFELLDLKKRYMFKDDLSEPLMDTICNAENDLRPFLEQRKESWEKHAECSLDFIRNELESGHRTLILDNELSDPVYIRFIVISQISSRVHECYRELQAKSIDREFCKTKESLNITFEILDNLLMHAI